MNRYVALLWSPQDEATTFLVRSISTKISNAFPTWENKASTDGLRIFHKPLKTPGTNFYELDNECGCILGTLFQRNANGTSELYKEAKIKPRESETIVRSQGRSLISDYWGRYIAFIRPKNGIDWVVVRDPSGGILCNRFSIDGIHIYFSHFDDVAQLNLKSFSPNRSYILAEFLNVELKNNACGLDDVQEVLMGESHHISSRSFESHFYWLPHEIADNDCFNTAGDAIEAIRSATEDCVSAWTSCFDRIIHNVSGGLDSAIVLGCMAKNHGSAEVTCLNYRTETQEGDEREFARAAARKAGFCLLEETLGGNDIQFSELVERLPRLESPSLNIFGTPAEDFHARIAIEHNADVFFSGEGGDHVFFGVPVSVIAADFLAMNGINNAFFNVVLQTAYLTKRHFWAVLRDALVYGWGWRAWNPDSLVPPQPLPFLDQAALQSVPENFGDYPWRPSIDKLPPAKATQVAILPNVLHRHLQFGRTEVADMVHPLFSQPIVEACLRTPTYLLTLDGVDRGLAREAFKDLIPNEIYLRNSKGGTGSYFIRMLVDNLPFIRTFLLEGILCQESFVKKEALDHFLSLRTFEEERNIYPVVKAIAIEAWLRKISPLALKAAA